MSNLPSPIRYNAENHFYDLEEKVREPLSMKMSEYDNLSSPQKRNEQEKLDMFVPDRILVVGQDQYYGTTAPPRELRLENSVRPPDPGLIRVETPPRVITMREHHFPTVGEDEDLSEPETPPPLPQPISKSIAPKSKALVSFNDSDWAPMASLNGSELVPRGLQPGEEVNHLRKQMAKLNRRMMAIELDNLQRQQREKYLFAIGLGYYLIKFLFWLNK